MTGTDHTTTAGIRRRTLLKGAAAGGAVAVAARVTGPTAAAQGLPPSAGDPALGAFRHGVASGDPMPDRVIIWTRVTPSPDALPGSGMGTPTIVSWEVASDPAFSSIVKTGSVVSTPNSDHTINVDVTGLAASTEYHYRFTAAGQTSPVGRTRTAPAAGAAVDNLRFAVVSCANWEAGYFAAYQRLAEREDFDYVLELGDYIYEYRVGGYPGKHGKVVRRHDPEHDIVTLEDYRRRFAQYHTDPSLQALHSRAAWICTWDDHEIADDAWSDGSLDHNPLVHGPYANRKAAGWQAYSEYLPIRPQAQREGGQLYRRFSFGSLAELNMLDLRSYRSKQGKITDGKVIDDPNRTMTGAAQFDWLARGLRTSTARWNVIGNSVMISPVKIPPLDPRTTGAVARLFGLPEEGLTFNADQWDGYPAERRRLLDVIREQELTNCVFVVGDVHSHWACDVPYNAAAYATEGIAGAEFVASSITSNNIDDELGLPEGNALSHSAAGALMAANGHIRMIELDRHGFALLDLTAEYAQMDYFVIADREDPDSPAFRYGGWRKPNDGRPIEPAPALTGGPLVPELVAYGSLGTPGSVDGTGSVGSSGGQGSAGPAGSATSVGSLTGGSAGA